jgi:hypothetical protein
MQSLPLTDLVAKLQAMIVAWCPKGSDPGLCVTESVPNAVIEWGLRCQRELLTQNEARQIATENGIHLEGLGGTHDGVIGALAAVGLLATRNDGRVVYFGDDAEDWYDVTGCLPVDDILRRGVDEVRIMSDGVRLTRGMVDVGKRLRPNYRSGQVVLYVAPRDEATWDAVRVT